MNRFILARLLLGLLGCVALLWSGCASSSGNLFGNAAHQLIPQAKALRASSTEPWPIPRELDTRVAPPYTVEPGDVLLLMPANLNSPVRLSGDQTVLPDGTIQLGRFGPLLVAGKTLPQIEVDGRALIEAQVKADPRILDLAPARRDTTDAADNTPPWDYAFLTARVVTRVSKVYYVLGEVNSPGAFPLQGREKVLDAILAAGGLNDRASRRGIILIRPTPPDSCRIVLPVCYNEIVQLGDTSTNYQIACGDRIYVPTRTCHNEKEFKKACGPCNRSQMPCPPPPCDHGHYDPASLAPPAAPPVPGSLFSTLPEVRNSLGQPRKAGPSDLKPPPTPPGRDDGPIAQ
jgi:polysaccharide export outer membrane protein